MCCRLQPQGSGPAAGRTLTTTLALTLTATHLLGSRVRRRHDARDPGPELQHPRQRGVPIVAQQPVDALAVAEVLHTAFREGAAFSITGLCILHQYTLKREVTVNLYCDETQAIT